MTQSEIHKIKQKLCAEVLGIPTGEPDWIDRAIRAAKNLKVNHQAYLELKATVAKIETKRQQREIPEPATTTKDKKLKRIIVITTEGVKLELDPSATVTIENRLVKARDLITNDRFVICGRIHQAAFIQWFH